MLMMQAFGWTQWASKAGTLTEKELAVINELRALLGLKRHPGCQPSAAAIKSYIVVTDAWRCENWQGVLCAYRGMLLKGKGKSFSLVPGVEIKLRSISVRSPLC